MKKIKFLKLPSCERGKKLEIKEIFPEFFGRSKCPKEVRRDSKSFGTTSCRFLGLSGLSFWMTCKKEKPFKLEMRNQSF